MKKTLISIVISLVLMAGSSWAAEVILIVNKDNATAEFSKEDVEKIYLGKKSEWGSGGKILPCDQKAETKAAEVFCKTYLRKSVSDYQASWMEKMLAGAATPPKSASNDQEVIDFVGKTRGAIGYVEAGVSLSDGVKKATVK